MAALTVGLNHTRVIAGSVLETTYRFTVAPDARFLDDYRVFVHVIDPDGEPVWNDDQDLAELQIVVDRSFVPALASAWASDDTRELGVRVFHAYVDAQRSH
ncbi:MAG: hypothetical protein DMF89_12865 [Acidobacteria bacterium]|nr:MAG: hypothetical protein DMF90_20070 [Acidobacteriota bacterium]PYR49343.1 MAG: hypothetical protein DMF89_12865 [Acidobacteriota bacterium]